ncbi:folylpolyglutamate synthase/dihydrofolate synthase family protein [Mahella sp.]|uniref:bifunctional folylpolyglutamate synthase/dihydrofolate synthase n=1 Tax=Mahella sp. TaxID=2798721 RepID=UPI0025C16410|nr:folylpolyglutamate synthase/dihydrofolate synthase family protein [Mahella sp.]MBZ4666636.1 FolC bifunctional protein [Mahella sp.]
MDYLQALDYIHGTWKFGTKLGLENISYLLQLLGNPHKKLRCIHIAGTNGKGSVAAMAASILDKAGYKTGLFISPYLEDFRERIQINGNYIQKDDLARLTQTIKQKVEQMLAEGRPHPTEFEIVTAIGFCYFAEQNVDYAVVEVGLGGRLDSTNLIDPLVSVITSIDYDHKDILGDTLAKIAYEKAGIIKPGRPVVVYPQQDEAMDVIKQVCQQRQAPLIEVSYNDIKAIDDSIEGQHFNYNKRNWAFDSLYIPLLGKHQLMNAATAITTALAMREYMGVAISDKAIAEGLSVAEWPGRLELVHRQPYVLLDGAHNPQGAQSLADAIKNYFPHNRVIMVLGILADKDVHAILENLVPLAAYIITTRPDSPRAMEAEKLLALVKEMNAQGQAIDDIECAVQASLDMAGQDDLVVISGSLYLIGSVRTYLKGALTH